MKISVAKLKSERLKQGLSLSDLSVRTRLTTGILSDLEDGRFARIGPPALVKECLKAYCKALGIDPTALSEEPVSRPPQSPPEPPVPDELPGIEAQSSPPRRHPAPIVALLVLAVALAAAGAWYGWTCKSHRQNGRTGTAGLDKSRSGVIAGPALHQAGKPTFKPPQQEAPAEASPAPVPAAPKASATPAAAVPPAAEPVHPRSAATPAGPSSTRQGVVPKVHIGQATPPPAQSTPAPVPAASVPGKPSPVPNTRRPVEPSMRNAATAAPAPKTQPAAGSTMAKPVSKLPAAATPSAAANPPAEASHPAAANPPVGASQSAGSVATSTGPVLSAASPQPTPGAPGEPAAPASGTASMATRTSGATASGAAANGAHPVGDGVGPNPAPTTAAHEATHTLVVEAATECWVQVREANGTKPKGVLLQPGQTRHWQVTGTVKLVLGNAGGARVIWDGKLLGLKGRPGRVLRLTLPSARQSSHLRTDHRAQPNG